MKKRSAMTIAAALVAALLVGTVAYSIGAAGPQTAIATTADVKPRVRTIEHTVTVHRDAKPKDVAPVIQTFAAPAAASVSSSQSYESDDQYEGEDGYEGGHEGGSSSNGGGYESEAGDD